MVKIIAIKIEKEESKKKTKPQHGYLELKYQRESYIMSFLEKKRILREKIIFKIQCSPTRLPKKLINFSFSFFSFREKNNKQQKRIAFK